MLSWWLTAALDPDFRLIQYFFLSNTEEFTPHRPSRSVANDLDDKGIICRAESRKSINQVRAEPFQDKSKVTSINSYHFLDPPNL